MRRPGPQAAQDQTIDVAPLVVAPRSQAILADLPGRISPVRVAEVRARVAGIVQKRHFEEGATVKEGDLLFTIEPAPFEAALARRRARWRGPRPRSARPRRWPIATSRW